jgi:hypothetical protein
VVDDEIELQEKLESLCNVLVKGDRIEDGVFPASIGEIVFS